jgi:hypothetical protein
MKLSIAYSVSVAFAIATAGCTADVEPTDDSVRVGAEVPKVEIGERSPDLDIRTDDDVDVDTPAPGDN